jgi:Cu/Ag efflux protein CusF
MKKAIALAVVLVFAFSIAGLVGTAPAATKKTSKSIRVTGEIVSVDPSANTVILKAKQGEMTLTVDDKTRIMAGRQHKTLADLKAGTTLKVKYQVVNGKNMASKIVIPTELAPINE